MKNPSPRPRRGAFARVKQVLMGAMELSPTERAAYVDEACVDDPTLEREIMELLDYGGDTPDILRTREALNAIHDDRAPSDFLSTVMAAKMALPTKIGRYPILGALGAGGMGVVYRGHDPALERDVAIKTLPSSFAADPDRMDRLRREAKLLATVEHAGVAIIYSIEESDHGPFLTMEYVPGRTLGEHIAEDPLDVERALQLGRQIATAIEASHAKGIVHRDLKPDNIRVTPDGRIKLLDFGLAQSIAGAADTRRPGEVAGTPGYMSPEQLRGQPSDHRTDIWAFGCVLYTSLVGHAPFPGHTPSDVLAATLDVEPDMSELPDGTPASLRQLLIACLSKAVELRPQDMAQVRREIDTMIAAVRHVVDAGPRRAPSAIPSNLRHAPSDLIGREDELTEVAALLRDRPLVTLTGAGGCGKTRLALEVAWSELESFPDGVWMVELAGLRDDDLLPATVLKTLGLVEAAGTSPIDTVIAYARSRTLLLVLDNCEHLIDAAARLVQELLGACPTLHVLATSREMLGIDGEWALPVQPLAPPPSVEGAGVEHVRASAAACLFLERARAVRPALQLDSSNAGAIAEICRRLDGIPLALELAAARVRVLSVDELAERLDQRFELLTSGRKSAAARHQTLRGLLDWSYALLDEKEQALFRRLAVFAGGWTLEAVEEVCAGHGIEAWEMLDLLTQLLTKSLVELDDVTRESVGKTRYRMLETVREYAMHALRQEGEDSRSTARHRAYFVGVAEAAGPDLHTREQAACLRRLDLEHDNVRLAMESCLSDDDGFALAHRLAVALGRYWEVRGHSTEGRSVCARLLARDEAASGTLARADLLRISGELAWRQADYSAARVQEESIAIYRRLGEQGRVADCLVTLGAVARLQGDVQQATMLYEEGLATYREVGDRGGMAAALNGLGLAAENRGDYAKARSLLQESLTIRREMGHLRGLAATLGNLGQLSEGLGDVAAARSLHEESLEIKRELNDRQGMAHSLAQLGSLAIDRGEYATARSLIEEGSAIRRGIGDRAGMAQSLGGLGNVALHEGDLDQARVLFERSLSLRRELGNRRAVGHLLNSLGTVAKEKGDYADARRLIEESLSIKRELGDRRGVAISLHNLGNVTRDQGELGTARRYLEEGLEILRDQGEKLAVAHSLISLGDVSTEQGDLEEARTFYDESLILLRDLGDRRGAATSLHGLGRVSMLEGSYAEARALHEESLAIRKELGDKQRIASSLSGIGVVAREQGDHGLAQSRCEESLALYLDIGDRRGIAESLIALGYIANERGRPARALRLMASGEQLARESCPLPPTIERRLHQEIRALRSRVGEEVFDREWTAGRSMTLEEVVAYAQAR